MKLADAARRTLPALIEESLREKRDAALIERRAGDWTPTSSEQLLERVRDVSCAIRAAGLRRGDRVALIAQDSVDWIVADLAVLFAGCVVVPIFPTQAADQVAYILQDSEAGLIFCDTPDSAARLSPVPLARVITFAAAGAGGFAAFEAQGARARSEQPQWPQELEREMKPDDLAVLIYTSGTTGEPKGVMLSHDNLVFTATSTFGYLFDFLQPGDRVLSVLPFSHIYEHCTVYGYMFSRVRHYICHRVEDLLEDLREVRPVTMTAVPRIFERVLAGIVGKSRIRGGLRARLVPWALRAGRRYMRARVRARRRTLALALQYRVARALVLRRIRPALGLQNLRFFVSGSAPLHFDTAMTFLACDIPIVQGYGPTECSPVISVNTIGDNRYGTVGKAIPGVEIKIAPDGEILARGPNVMRGYYKNEEATVQAIQDGWYKSGDLGALSADGFLTITDRKRELFKTSNGKFIAPSRLESAISRSIYVDQVMVTGNARPYPVALVSPNWELLRTALGIDPALPKREASERSDVSAFLRKEVEHQTGDLARFERVRGVVVLPAELTIEAGELSPTLKVKRRVVEERYAPQIDQTYARSPLASPD